MKKLFALLTLILWSISTAASATSAMSVLCVEKSGAISIEYSFGTRCADADEAGATLANSTAAVTDMHCASCTDSSLSPSVSNSVSRVTAKILPAKPATDPIVLVTTPVAVREHGMRAPPRTQQPEQVRSAYLAQRHTIVLLQ